MEAALRGAQTMISRGIVEGDRRRSRGAGELLERENRLLTMEIQERDKLVENLMGVVRKREDRITEIENMYRVYGSKSV